MLVTINGKEYGFFNRFKPIYQEVEKLINLCEAGSPREVLKQVKKCGFDDKILQCPFLIRENSPIPVHPMAHPFTTACNASNLPVVRLMMELGADPDAVLHSQKTIRQAFADSTQVIELFEGGKNWWKAEYPEAKKMRLQGDLGGAILAGEPSEAIWLMLHGVWLTSPGFLASDEFGKQSHAFKEVVCRMGIPDEQLNDFHGWLKVNCADEDVLELLDAMIRGKEDEENQEIVEKLLLSVNLLRDAHLGELVAGTLPFSDQIRLLKGLVSEFDGSNHQRFIEKTIAALLKEILCACWEV